MPLFALSTQDELNLTAFLKDLVSTPSFSCHEKEVAERLKVEMQAVGFDEVWTDRIGSVVGRFGSGNGRTLLLDAHMDTVGVGDPTAWQHDPFGAVVEDGFLYGRGAADMKGALASMVYAAKLLKDSGVRLAGDLYVVGVVQEEPCEGGAVRILIEEGDVVHDPEKLAKILLRL